MHVQLVGSCSGSVELRQHLTSFVINDSVAIDAGSLGMLSPLRSQLAVRHVLLSHSHIDHVATLPIFLDNVFHPGGPCPTVYASGAVWESLRSDVFNERLWPDLERLAIKESRFYTPVVIESETPILIAGLRITPVAVDHVVPTLGFLIEDDRSAIVIASDTGPTSRLWERASQSPFRQKLRAVFLECSFPDSMAELAKGTKHHCPASFAQELKKLAPQPPWQTVVMHLKAAHHDEIAAELRHLSIPNLQIGVEVGAWSFAD